MPLPCIRTYILYVIKQLREKEKRKGNEQEKRGNLPVKNMQFQETFFFSFSFVQRYLFIYCSV